MKTFLDLVRVLLAPGETGGSPSSAGAQGDAGAASAVADAGDDIATVEEVPDQADAAAAADTVEDDDDPDDDYADLKDLAESNPRIKSVINRTRKSARQLRRQREIVDGMRGPGGRFLNPTELRQKAEYWDRVEARATKNARLRSMLFDDDEPEPASKKASAAKATDGADDPFKEFDPDHPATPLLRRLYDSNQQLQSRLDKVETGVRQSEQKQTQAEQRAEVATWTEAIDQAAKTLPKIIKLPTGGTMNLRDVFADSVKGAFSVARQRGMRLDVKQVIAHYLKQAGVNTQTATRVAADAQRAAEHNKSLPRAGAVVPGGRPAPAKTTKETVAEVSRRIQGRRF